jgi:hypothetical protein
MSYLDSLGLRNESGLGEKEKEKEKEKEIGIGIETGKGIGIGIETGKGIGIGIETGKGIGIGIETGKGIGIGKGKGKGKEGMQKTRVCPEGLSLKSIYGENALFFLKDLQSDLLHTGFLPTDVSCELLDILDACVTVKVSSVPSEGDVMELEFQVEVDPV